MGFGSSVTTESITGRGVASSTGCDGVSDGRDSSAEEWPEPGWEVRGGSGWLRLSGRLSPSRLEVLLPDRTWLIFRLDPEDVELNGGEVYGGTLEGGGAG